jgi:hypothetical protein
MVNLKNLNFAVKHNIPLNIAKENLKIQEEQNQFKEQYKKELNDLGVITI